MKKPRKKILEAKKHDKQAQKYRFMFYGLLAFIGVMLCGLLYIGWCRGMAVEGSIWKKDNFYKDTTNSPWDRVEKKKIQKDIDRLVNATIFKREEYIEVEVLKNGKTRKTLVKVSSVPY